MEISMGYVSVPFSYFLCNTNLAPQSNILIDHNGRACLAGFSLLTIIPDGLVITSSDLPGGRAHWMGGVRWSAPEVLNGGTPSRKTDIFSLAMIMVEVFY